VALDGVAAVAAAAAIKPSAIARDRRNVPRMFGFLPVMPSVTPSLLKAISPAD
jgi:hypothetical protein